MNKFLALPLLVIFSLTANATQVRHIVSSSQFESQVVRVVINDELKAYQFSICESVTSENCRLIGRAEGYTEQELVALRRSKRLAAFGINALDVTAMIGSVIGGTLIGLGVGSTLETISIFGQVGVLNASTVGLGGLVTGPAVAGTGISVIRFLNPLRRWQEANTIAAKKLAQLKDKDMIVDITISDYAQNLNAILTGN